MEEPIFLSDKGKEITYSLSQLEKQDISVECVIDYLVDTGDLHDWFKQILKKEPEALSNFLNGVYPIEDEEQ
jgi:hypothetical protein